MTPSTIKFPLTEVPLSGLMICEDVIPAKVRLFLRLADVTAWDGKAYYKQEEVERAMREAGG